MGEIGEYVPDRDNVYTEGTTLSDIDKLINVKNPSKLPGAVLKVWHKKIRATAMKVAAAPLKNFEMNREGQRILPSDMVAIDGDLVFIHGIRHSVLGTGKGHESEELVDIVRDYVDGTVSEGHDWVVEEGLEKDFGIEGRVTPLQDMKEFFGLLGQQMHLQEEKSKNFFKKLRLCGRLITATATGFTKVGDAITYKQNRELNGLTFNAAIGLKKDPRYHIKSIELGDTLQLPQPLDMEVGLAMATNGGDLEKPNILIDRSYLQAQLVRERLKVLHAQQGEKKPATVHLLCGDLHRKQVGYFLKNPEYDVRASIRKWQNNNNQ
jgi:hypothetical protein